MILGIDIAKREFDVTLLRTDGQRKHRCFANTPRGLEQLRRWLVRQGVTQLHACMEATNIYWEAVAQALHEAGYVVSVVNPARIKGFAMSQLRRTKTDKQDSADIAAYCAQQRPKPWTPPGETQRKLRSLERHRAGLEKTRTQQKNRLAESQDADVTRSLQKLIDLLNQEIAALEKQMEELIAHHESLRQTQALLLSITGIGPRTTAKLMAEMYDLADYANAAAAAADAGLTPAQYESGATVRRRPKLSKVGKASVRGALYLPALNAMRTNPVLRAFAHRLRQRHKPEKVIIAAVMRKLLHIAYGVLKNQTPFDPTWGTTAPVAA